MNILAYVWLIGAIALMLLNVLRYIRLNIKIRKNGEVISCPETREYTDRKSMFGYGKILRRRL